MNYLKLFLVGLVLSIGSHSFALRDHDLNSAQSDSADPALSTLPTPMDAGMNQSGLQVPVGNVTQVNSVALPAVCHKPTVREVSRGVQVACHSYRAAVGSVLSLIDRASQCTSPHADLAGVVSEVSTGSRSRLEGIQDSWRRWIRGDANNETLSASLIRQIDQYAIFKNESAQRLMPLLAASGKCRTTDEVQRHQEQLFERIRQSQDDSNSTQSNIIRTQESRQAAEERARRNVWYRRLWRSVVGGN